ncbi:MAG: hypothetical protein AAF998_22330 [Bacteroidota bacterium]
MDAALKYFSDGTRLFEELYQANPHNTNLLWGLVVSDTCLYDIYQSTGQMELAKAALIQAEQNCLQLLEVADLPKYWRELIYIQTQKARLPD